jgi:hypothetical protein
MAPQRLPSSQQILRAATNRSHKCKLYADRFPDQCFVIPPALSRRCRFGFSVSYGRIEEAIFFRPSPKDLDLSTVNWPIGGFQPALGLTNRFLPGPNMIILVIAGFVVTADVVYRAWREKAKTRTVRKTAVHGWRPLGEPTRF